MHEDIIATIPQDQRGDHVLEVAITYDAAHTDRVELRDLMWANGIGWYRQKTLALEADAAEALLKSLGQARRRLVPRDAAPERGNVIPFPVPRSNADPSRHVLPPTSGPEALHLKKTCCERFKRKGRACKTCPTMAKLPPGASSPRLQVSQKV